MWEEPDYSDIEDFSGGDGIDNVTVEISYQGEKRRYLLNKFRIIRSGLDPENGFPTEPGICFVGELKGD